MRVAVFGHYDSRGGTTAMPFPSEAADDAANLKTAKYQYDVGIWGEEILDHKEEDRPSHHDFLFITELEGAEYVDDNADLDAGHCDGSDNERVPGKGTWVVAPPGFGEDDDFVTYGGPAGAPPMLVVVPSGFIPTGWSHPRWDDDAFGFLLGVS